MSQRFTGTGPTGASINFTGTGSFTACGWVYVQNATAGDVCYLDPGAGASGNSAIWLGFEPTSYRFQNRIGGVGFDVSVALTLNQWHHIGITFDGTNTTAYIDGAIVSGPTATSVAGRANMNFLDLGYGGDLTLQDSMLFSVALTTAQMQEVMRTQNPPSGITPYAWYKLSNAAPTTDNSGNGHTLSGAGASNGLQILAAAAGTVQMKGTNLVVPGVAAVSAVGTVQMKGTNIVVPALAAVSAIGTVLMKGDAVVTTGGGGGVVQITATGTILMSGAAAAPAQTATAASGTTLMSGSAAASGVAAVAASGTVLTKGSNFAAAALAAVSAAGTTLMTGTAQTTGGVNPFPNPGTPSHIRRAPASITGRRSTRR